MTLGFQWLDGRTGSVGPNPPVPADPEAVVDARPLPAVRNPATVVLLHGFTQNADCWGRFGPALTGRLRSCCRLLAIDAPGHGASGHDGADLWSTADLVVEAVDQATVAGRPIGPGTNTAGAGSGNAADDEDGFVIIGYSMGGRAALHVALAHRTRVAAMVLVGATAGLADPGQRRQRRAADEALARRLEEEPLSPFIDWWLDRPMFAGLTAESAARAARLANRREGLAATLRHCGTGAQESLWHRLGELSMPVLLLHGRRDRKFGDTATAMACAVGDGAEVVAVEGNHAVHLERPDETAEVIAGFLARRTGLLPPP